MDINVTSYVIQAGISLVVSIITLLGGYFIYGPKLRKQQKLEFQKEIGKSKAKVLIEFKDLIQTIDAIEVYDIDKELESGKGLSIRDPDIAIYPEIMNDYKTLNKFTDKVIDLRNKEKYLDMEAAAYLLYLYK